MTEVDRNALIPLPSGALAKVRPGPERILSGMVSDALDLARSQDRSLTLARFQIGIYEFRDADYRQILLWAEALKLEPVVVVQRLEGSFEFNYPGSAEVSVGLAVEDGAIVSMVWNFISSPILDFAWVDGLAIRKIVFHGTATVRISLPLPKLNYLKCSRIGITELDLSNVPALAVLDCSGNQIIELDLSNVPALAMLDCSGNQITELDLSNVPALDGLYFRDNQLTHLDLSNVHALAELTCTANQLTELNLSNVPALGWLECSGNRLTALDLSNVPALAVLECSGNQITELDLSNVPALEMLECSDNEFTALDLSHVPMLFRLDCSDNKITELDIRLQTELKHMKHDPSVTLKKLATQDPK